jgi:hypothetical protein
MRTPVPGLHYTLRRRINIGIPRKKIESEDGDDGDDGDIILRKSSRIYYNKRL